MYSKLTWLPLLAATPSIAETIHSVLVYSRHGDRTAKFYNGYQMTNLGATQVYDSGNYYRQRYIEDGAPSKILNISSDEARASQIWASAPDQGILYQTATNFLQGLYPPLGSLSDTLGTETITNGTETEGPLNGYQYIHIHGEGATDPDMIWIKGDEKCPAYEEAYDSYTQSAEYKATVTNSASFYHQFIPLLGAIMSPQNVSYSHAFDVYDLLHVASIHNSSVAESLSPTALAQLRYYADEWEWNHNFNATMPDRSIGGMTLAGGILRQMSSIVEGDAKVKFSLMAGSYDTMLAFFGLTNLNVASEDFMGLPGYASSFAFELFSDGDEMEFPRNPDEELNVRFLFKNGTDDADLTAFPLFGRTELTMRYGEFVDVLGSRAIRDVETWCSVCGSQQEFCMTGAADAGPGSTSSGSGSGLSNVEAGAIGAAVTIGVLTLFAGLMWLVMRRLQSRKMANTGAPMPGLEKIGSESSGSSSVV